MQIVIDIPNSDIPLKQNVITLDLHFIDGHICECTYPFKELPKKHGRLIDEREVKKAQFIINDQWGSYPVISLGNLNCVPTILEAEEVDEYGTGCKSIAR